MNGPLPTYYVWRFLPYNIRYLGAFLDPLPTLELEVLYERSLCLDRSKYQIGEKIVTWHKREI